MVVPRRSNWVSGVKSWRSKSRRCIAAMAATSLASWENSVTAKLLAPAKWALMFSRLPMSSVWNVC